jgi:hypothetical protein
MDGNVQLLKLISLEEPDAGIGHEVRFSGVYLVTVPEGGDFFNASVAYMLLRIHIEDAVRLQEVNCAVCVVPHAGASLYRAAKSDDHAVVLFSVAAEFVYAIYHPELTAAIQHGFSNETIAVNLLCGQGKDFPPLLIIMVEGLVGSYQELFFSQGVQLVEGLLRVAIGNGNVDLLFREVFVVQTLVVAADP